VQFENPHNKVSRRENFFWCTLWGLATQRRRQDIWQATQSINNCVLLFNVDMCMRNEEIIGGATAFKKIGEGAIPDEKAIVLTCSLHFLSNMHLSYRITQPPPTQNTS
jgi:hypothetical protein